MEHTECLALSSLLDSFSPESTDTESFPSCSENDEVNFLMVPTSVPTKEKAAELLSLKDLYPDNDIWKQTQQYVDAQPNSELQELEPEPEPKGPCRVQFSAEQTAALENKFRLCKYLQKPRRIKLAKELSLDERKILTWFQNRRLLERRLYSRSQFNNNHNICSSPPLMHPGWPTVSPFPAPLMTSAAPVSRLSDWYQDFQRSIQFNIENNISPNDNKENNDPNSASVIQPLVHAGAGWNTVSPFLAPSTTSAEPVRPVPRVSDWYQDFHSLSQFNNEHNMSQSKPNEQHYSGSSVGGRPLINPGWPRVSPFPAPLQTMAEPIPRVPDWYQDFHPSAYPNFTQVPPNSRDGFYGHGQYWPNDFKYNSMG